jgi:hypothetical protein
MIARAIFNTLLGDSKALSFYLLTRQTGNKDNPPTLWATGALPPTSLISP